MTRSLLRTPALVIGAAGVSALLWLALVNGFPLLYYDTGTYLKSAVYRLVAPVDRPVVYGWFIYATSLNATPWLVVLAQAAIATWVMHKVLRITDPTSTPASEALCILLTAALSSAPVFVGQLMPDFFTGVLPLAIFLLTAGYSRLAAFERWALFLLIAIAVGSHTSHAFIAAAALIGLVLARAWLPPGARRAASASRSGLMLSIAAIATACVVVSATNYAQYVRFTLSPGAHVFLMGRLLADGPAARHLQRACPAAGYRLCAFVDALPRTETDYIWGEPWLMETGGWLGSRDESWQIIRRTIAEEPSAVLANALTAAAVQLLVKETLRDVPVLPSNHVGSSRVDLQACKLEYSIVSPK